MAHDLRIPLVRLVDEALGDSRAQTRAGAVDNEATGEDDALAPRP